MTSSSVVGAMPVAAAAGAVAVAALPLAAAAGALAMSSLPGVGSAPAGDRSRCWPVSLTASTAAAALAAELRCSHLFRISTTSSSVVWLKSCRPSGISSVY